MTTLREEISSEFDGRFCGDARHKFQVGDVGFLMELSPQGASKRLELRDSPVRTSGTLEDLLFGTVDGGRTTVEALGAAKVVSVASNGRGKIQTIWGDELKAALETLGYPELWDSSVESDSVE